jgi:hypothetical protein
MAASSFAQSPAPILLNVNAKSGVEAWVTVHSNWNGRCQQRSPVAVTITKLPRNGEVSVRVTEEPKPPGCASNVLGTGIYYKSKPGFVGTDEFSYERGADAGGDSRLAGVRKVTVRVTQ